MACECPSLVFPVCENHERSHQRGCRQGGASDLDGLPDYKAEKWFSMRWPFKAIFNRPHPSEGSYTIAHSQRSKVLEGGFAPLEKVSFSVEQPGLVVHPTRCRSWRSHRWADVVSPIAFWMRRRRVTQTSGRKTHTYGERMSDLLFHWELCTSKNVLFWQSDTESVYNLSSVAD